MFLVILNYWYIIRRDFINKLLLSVVYNCIPKINRISCENRTALGGGKNKDIRSIILIRFIFELLLCYNIFITRFDSQLGYYNSDSKKLNRNVISSRSVRYISVFGTVTHRYLIASRIANITWFFDFHMAMVLRSPVNCIGDISKKKKIKVNSSIGSLRILQLITR